MFAFKRTVATQRRRDVVGSLKSGLISEWFCTLLRFIVKTSLFVELDAGFSHIRTNV
jgi:hypothetical protein